MHPLGCTLYVVLRLQESVCQKDKEKNRRTRTDSLNGRALYNWVQPCRGILKIYAEYFAFFQLIVCLNSHNQLRAKCGLDHETASRTDRGNTIAHAPNRPIKDDSPEKRANLSTAQCAFGMLRPLTEVVSQLFTAAIFEALKTTDRALFQVFI